MKIVGTILAVLILAGGAAGAYWITKRPASANLPKEVTVLGAPATGPLSGAIEDDVFETKVKRPLEFDSELTLRETVDGKLLNNSEAVIDIDLDLVDPKSEPVFAKLYPSFHAAYEAAKSLGPDKSDVLVSSSLVYSRTREFDHGLVIVAEMALINGKNDKGFGMVSLLKKLFERLPKTSAVRPYVAAALEIGGEKVEVFPEEITRKNAWISRYRNQTLAVAQPMDYYAWNDETRRFYELVRFLQDDFPNQYFRVATDMASALLEQPDLLSEYDQITKMVQLLSRNRREFLVLDFATVDPTDDPSRKKVIEKHQDFIRRLQCVPETSRREVIHFAEYLPMGCGRELDPMAELIQRSIVGLVTIMPRSGNPGIEQVQAIALDSFLSEATGPETDKTLLTRTYRERLIRPNYAVEVTTSDPSSVRAWQPWRASDTGRIRPLLRVEPVPGFYLRLARNYRYIGSVLKGILGENTYAQAKRMLPDGNYAAETMPNEIDGMMRRMYGLYLVCCEDLGVKPNFGEQDTIDREVCYREAIEWLKTAFDEPDSSRDARYNTVVHFRPFTREVLCWSTIGVRLQKLEVQYARRPQLRSTVEGSLWVPPDDTELGTSRYVLPVLELAGVDMRSRFGLDPKQFREICDKHTDRQSIIDAIYALDPPAGALPVGMEEQPKAESPEAKKPQAPVSLEGLPDPTKIAEPGIESGIGIAPQ